MRQKLEKSIMSRLNLVGLNPNSKDTPFWSILKSFMVFTFLLSTIMGLLLELGLNFKGLGTFAHALEILPAMYQGVLKLWCLLFWKKDLIKLIKTCNTFWSQDIFNTSQRQYINSPMILVDRVYKAFTALGLIASFQYIISIFYNKGHTMFLSYGDQDGLPTPYYELTLMVQLVYIASSLCFVIAYDILFLYFIASAIAEFRMIRIAFSSQILHDPYWRNRNRFLKTVQHHANLLRFVKNLSNFYTNLMLQQFLSTLFSICFCIFLLTFDGLSVGKIQKYGTMVVTYLIQIGQFCIAGSFLLDEGKTIVDTEFYKSMQAESLSKYKMGALMIIQRSQKPEGISIGGYGWLDLVSFTYLLKNALSFLTFMQVINSRINK